MGTVAAFGDPLTRQVVPHVIISYMQAPVTISAVHPIAIFMQHSEETTASSNVTVSTVKDAAQAGQAIVTTLALLLGGGWAFYVFVLGRSFAPIVELRFLLKNVLDTKNGKVAVVTAKVKNIGKTRVRNGTCRVGYKVLRDATPDYFSLQQLEALDLSNISDPLASGLEWKPILFGPQAAFEPGEETSAEIVVHLGTAKVFKIIGGFTTRFRPPSRFWRTKTITYTQTAILDIAAFNVTGVGEDEEDDDASIRRR